MTTYPYASPGKIQSSLDAIGARFIGSQEVTLWKQILVAIGNGGINPPFDPIVITAPGGAYAGAPLIITGGAYAVYSDGEYVLAVGNELLAVQVYQFVINGTPIGDWVTSPTTIPESVLEGDVIQVQDIAGNLSNELIGLDPLFPIWMAFRFQSHRLEPESYYDVIEVTGANVSGVNGIYRLSLTGTWENAAGYYFVDQEANGQYWIKHDSVSPNQFYMQSTEGNLDPWDSSYVDIGGGSPVPLVYRTQEPQYKPLGLYTAPDFVTPAVIDQQVGGWEYPGKPARVTESNLMLQPTLRSEYGMPVLEFSGDALQSHAPEVIDPHTAITVLAKTSFASWQQAIVVGDETQAARIGSNGSGFINADIANPYIPLASGIMWTDRPWRIVTLTLSEGVASLYVDGTLAASESGLAPVVTLATGVSLGGDWNTLIGTQDPWQGDIIAAYGYNAADRLKVEAYCETLKGGVL